MVRSVFGHMGARHCIEGIRCSGAVEEMRDIKVVLGRLEARMTVFFWHVSAPPHPLAQVVALHKKLTYSTQAVGIKVETDVIGAYQVIHPAAQSKSQLWMAWDCVMQIAWHWHDSDGM